MQKYFTLYKPYFKQITKLSYPIIIGQIGIVLMGVADTIMIGKVDATNLAAAGLANSIYFLVTILGVGTLSAVSPLVAKAKGAGHRSETSVLFNQSINVAVVLGVIISFILWIVTINMHWFGQDDEVEILIKPYLHILNAGNIFMLLFMGIKQFSDGLSITKPAAIITILGLFFNVFWNWVLIYGNLGFPALGLNGAGYATTGTRVFMFIALLLFVYTHKSYKHWLTVKEKSNATEFFVKIFTIGLPSGMQYFFEVAAFSSAAIIIGWFGKDQLAAHQIAINLASVTYMIATGIANGGSIVVGESFGMKNKRAMILSGRASIFMSICFMSFTALGFVFFNTYFVSLYTNDVHVANMASNLLIIAAMFQLSDGTQTVSLGILRGILDTKVPTLITALAYWVIGIPIGWILAKYFQLNLYGIWFGLTLGLTFSAILLSWRFFRNTKRINFVLEEKLHYKTLAK